MAMASILFPALKSRDKSSEFILPYARRTRKNLGLEPAAMANGSDLEPIQEEVESHESVVILYRRLIREGVPDVESRTPSCSRAARPTISQRSDEPRMGIGGADDSTGQTWRPTA